MSAQMQAQEATIEISADVLNHGDIDLDFGRPTHDGEQPTASGAINALSPRGKFFCLRLSGATPAAAEQTLTAAGYTVHFNPPPGTSGSGSIRSCPTPVDDIASRTLGDAAR